MNVVLTTMHKVKGLEFDAVIITLSVTSLPFNPTEDIDISLPLSNSDIEQIEEERRLLYVSYTRAKKFLFVYKGYRELAVETYKDFQVLKINGEYANEKSDWIIIILAIQLMTIISTESNLMIILYIKSEKTILFLLFVIKV